MALTLSLHWGMVPHRVASSAVTVLRFALQKSSYKVQFGCGQWLFSCWQPGDCASVDGPAGAANLREAVLIGLEVCHNFKEYN